MLFSLLSATVFVVIPTIANLQETVAHLEGLTKGFLPILHAGDMKNAKKRQGWKNVCV